MTHIYTITQFQIIIIRQQLGETNYVTLMSRIDIEILREASQFVNLFIPIPEADLHNSSMGSMD